MKQPEHILQVNCVNYFRLRYPKGLIYAIPNGGQRNVIVASKMKAEGVLSGVPDLHIPIAKKGYNGLYIIGRLIQFCRRSNQAKSTNPSEANRPVFHFADGKEIIHLNEAVGIIHYSK